MDSENSIRINHYTESTTVLGPGNRFVVWTQGCKKRCKNCINPDGQSLSGGKVIKVNDLVALIAKQKELQGVTISGGEPFLQFPALFELVVKVKSSLGLDIMLYSGYTLDEINAMLPEKLCKTFFEFIDIFVDGEYVDALNDNQLFRGSSNQNIYFFTSKYKTFAEKILLSREREFEFTVNADSETFMVGIPPKDFYGEFLKLIEEEGEKNG